MSDLAEHRITADTRFRTKSLGNVTVRQAAEMGSLPIDGMVEAMQALKDRGCFRLVGLDLFDFLDAEDGRDSLMQDDMSIVQNPEFAVAVIAEAAGKIIAEAMRHLDGQLDAADPKTRKTMIVNAVDIAVETWQEVLDRLKSGDIKIPR